MEDELAALEDVRGIAEGLEQCVIAKIGAIAATDQKYLLIAPRALRVQSIKLVSDVTTASSAAGSKEYGFKVKNLTQNNDLGATDTVTSDTEITADTAYTITVDQNLDIAAGDVLELQVTKTGSPTSLAAAEIIVMIAYKDNSYS